MDFTFKRLLNIFNRPSAKKQDTPPVAESYQRSFNRFPLEFEVIVSVIDSDEHPDTERSELHDVSGGGAMFISRLPERYFPGQLLKLDIFLAGTQDVRACIKTEASVVRIHPIKNNDAGHTPDNTVVKTGIAVKFHKPFEFERIDSSFLNNLP